MRWLLVLSLLVSSGCVSQKRISRAGSLVDLGTAYYREGNYEGAVSTLRDATRTDPRNWRGFNALALAYIAKGQPDLAEDAFRRALKLNPDEAEILVNHGALQLNQGKPAEAVATFRHALEDLDYRNQALALSNLSLACLQAGQPDDALAAAREAVRRTPLLCEGWFHAGLALEAKGDPDGAMEAYTELIQRCPAESVGARLRMGCLQAQGPVPELGIRTLEAVVSEVPGTALADQARSCIAGARR